MLFQTRVVGDCVDKVYVLINESNYFHTNITQSIEPLQCEDIQSLTNLQLQTT